MDNFLKTLEKMSRKKRQLTNISKLKFSISKAVIITTFNKFGKKGLSISTLEIEVSSFITQSINMAMIGANSYYTTYKLKKIQIFIVSMKDLKYQAQKKARIEINLQLLY